MDQLPDICTHLDETAMCKGSIKNYGALPMTSIGLELQGVALAFCLEAIALCQRSQALL